MSPDELSTHNTIVQLINRELPGLDPVDIMAFCEIESSFNTKAYRYEKRLFQASYGLMQVLASDAKDRGLIGDPTQMFEPEIGLRMGMRQVAWTAAYLEKHLPKNVPIETVAAAYNAGVGNVLHGFANEPYVDAFVKAKAKWIDALNK